MPSHLDGYGYLFESATGRLVSRGTVFMDPLPDGLELVEHSTALDDLTERWSESARDVVPFSAEERAAEFDERARAATAEAVRLRGGS